jgi:glycopeptide antibiotics resistance protein
MTIGGTGVMLVGCLAALVVFVALARSLRPRLGPVTSTAIAGFGWTVVCIGILTLIPAEWGIGVVPLEEAQTSCSLDYGGPAPDGFWILPGSQRLLNMAVFVPAGALWVLAVARWRAGWVLAPLGIATLALYSLLIEAAQLAAARIGRACDVTDLVDNVSGAVLGGLLGVGLALVLRPWRQGRPSGAGRR